MMAEWNEILKSLDANKLEAAANKDVNHHCLKSFILTGKIIKAVKRQNSSTLKEEQKP